AAVDSGGRVDAVHGDAAGVAPPHALRSGIASRGVARHRARHVPRRGVAVLAGGGTRGPVGWSGGPGDGDLPVRRDARTRRILRARRLLGCRLVSALRVAGTALGPDAARGSAVGRHRYVGAREDGAPTGHPAGHACLVRRPRTSARALDSRRAGGGRRPADGEVDVTRGLRVALVAGLGCLVLAGCGVAETADVQSEPEQQLTWGAAIYRYNCARFHEPDRGAPDLRPELLAT